MSNCNLIKRLKTTLNWVSSNEDNSMLLKRMECVDVRKGKWSSIKLLARCELHNIHLGAIHY